MDIRKKWLLVTATLTALLVPGVAHAATYAELSGTLCRMPYAQDPYVQTSIQRDVHGWKPASILVGCSTLACDPVDTVSISWYGRLKTGQYAFKGGTFFLMPNGWKHGYVDTDVPNFDGVRMGRDVMAVVTLTKRNGRHCTVVNSGTTPRM